MKKRSRWLLPIVMLTMALVGGSMIVRSKRTMTPAAATTSTAAFAPTRENPGSPPGPAPDGMVWIPGGEFSMGAADPTGGDANAVGMQATTDSRPIHRVYVDGFWMDKTN